MEKNLGHATAYGYAKSKGYSGTEDEFAQLMADYASVGQSAAQSAEQAAASATSASGSATTASQAAQTATSKASVAVTAAGTATTKASEASTSAGTASTAAQTATDKASIATTAAATATTKADEAEASATTASTAKTDAESARDAAAQSASEAAESAESIDPDEFDRKIYAAFATDIATGAIASFPDGADSIPMKNVVVHIEPVQAGSGDPSPDNVRPITGWTGAKVTRTGKNLLDTVAVNRTHSGVTYTHMEDGSISVIGTATPNTSYSADFGKKILKAGTYKLSVTGLLSGMRLTIVNETIQSVVATTTTIASFTLRNDTPIHCYIAVNKDVVVNTTAYVQIESGSTATDYEPYSGQTYDITFPTEAGTVYGGTLDVTKGELVVDRAFVTISNVRPNGITSNSSRFIFAPIPAKANGRNNFITNMFGHLTSAERAGVATGREASGNVEFYLPTTVSQTAEAGIQWFAENPTQFVYELATPIIYQLTQQEITSLLGANNLWADTGDSEVEYRADTKLYITKKITEAVSALS